MPDQVTAADSNALAMLQDLATVCRDSQEGYRTAINDTSDLDLKALFERFAHRRQQEADELDQVIRELGGQPGSRTGSLGGTAHRLFVALRAALTGSDRAAALHEVARGESYAEAVFDRAKRLNLTDRAREVVQRLHDSVRETRDQVRRMAANAGGWSDTLNLAAGKRSIETVGQYVTKNPMTSGVIALGVGFLLGAFMIGLSRGNGTGRRRAEHRRRPRYGNGMYDPTGRLYGDQDHAGG
jgi:uncharacterized protein (TIGR02284 family)